MVRFLSPVDEQMRAMFPSEIHLNRFHARIVNATEARAGGDVFSTVFGGNGRRTIARQAGDAGLRAEAFDYIGQCPNHPVFNRAPFWSGSFYEKTIGKFALTRPHAR
jgi:hypothetical protein